VSEKVQKEKGKKEERKTQERSHSIQKKIFLKTVCFVSAKICYED